MKKALLTNRLSFLLLAALVIPHFVFAQIYKQSILDTNKVYTIFNNRGSIGHPATSVAGLIWPWSEQSALPYIREMGLLIGGEVIDTQGDTIHIINDGFYLAADGDYEPGTTNPWGWLPLPGYDNPDSNRVAISDDPTTWNPSWQAWPGKYGSGNLRADLETLWVMNDSSNAEFDYYPLANDSSFQGLGIEVSCRGYQWDTPNFEDFIIFTYEIKNISDRPLNKLTVGFFGDPTIGGTNDFSDDDSGYDLNENLMYCWDHDGIGDGGIIPGYLGFVTLESPDNVGLTSVVSVFFGGNNRPKNDSVMWNFMTPGTTNLNAQQADYVVIFGSGYFSLQAGETKTYSIACVLGTNLIDLYNNVQESRSAYSIVTSIKNTDITRAPISFSLNANYPNPFNPATTISYEIPQTANVKLTIYNSLGQLVNTLINTKQNAGTKTLTWDGRDQAGKMVSSGIYIYRLQADGFTQSRKMLLLR